ncbi:MAG: [Fe-Fe] hydrogenase large subunit C-terminal domain-containing protein [Synergistales bacterium]
METGIKVLEGSCKGCVNCIKSCPTEALRVVDGRVKILSELCIDCGECLRSCREKALALDEDDWDLIRSHGPVVLMADPTFCAQFSHYWSPGLVRKALASLEAKDLFDQAAKAFDLAAFATARQVEEASKESLPLISVYCPAVVRLIQVRFPELLHRLVRTENPLETGTLLWRRQNGSNEGVILVTPCSAKVMLVRGPVGRGTSMMDHVVSVKRLARDLLAAGPKVDGTGTDPVGSRWLAWALRGGESRHVKAFSRKPLTTMAVSGLRNTIDLLQDLELGRLKGVDFVECRVCDLGCIGGIGNAESRFLSELRLSHQPVEWNVTESEKTELSTLYETGAWALEQPIQPRPRPSLADTLDEAMKKLKTMQAVYAELPHIDCGACGRPSCRALAEDVVRGEGEVTDCVFKLRERIAILGEEITSLSGKLPHAFHERKHAK